MSHELLEAITDPFEVSAINAAPPGVFPTGVGFTGTDPANIAFEYVTSPELMDMCTLIPDGTGHGAFYTPADFPYTMQRGWSNEAASHWKDPCLPAPAGEVYFNSVPVLPDTFSFPDIFYVLQHDARGQGPAIGQTKTIEIDLWE